MFKEINTAVTKYYFRICLFGFEFISKCRNYSLDCRFIKTKKKTDKLDSFTLASFLTKNSERFFLMSFIFIKTVKQNKEETKKG